MTTRFFIGIILDEDGEEIHTCLCHFPHTSWQSAEACARSKSFRFERVGHREVKRVEKKEREDVEG